MDHQVQKKLEIFFSQFKNQIFKKGELLIRADADPQGVYYLREGIVKMYAISAKGDEIVLNTFKPISFFPMTWGLNQTPNKYYFESVEIANVCKAPRDKVVEFLKENPDVALDLLRRLCRGIDGMLSRMNYLMAGNANARLVTELIIYAKRFGKPLKDGSVSVRVNERELAASAGITKETVSREMKRLIEMNLVEFTRNFLVVYDIKKLEAVLEEC